ncbi:unnamed protein product [Pieris brassicae]|uniref:Uncharacterized protein n=1 Tax=Pieris brassicae TaxID=7116 RepID=A0A9P0TLE7_PIEBR|nr:unnamed protein product [Pieris brassicae]
MDNAAGTGSHGTAGRHRLRYGSLVLGAFLTMHCRVAASALTGGFFLFILFLVAATAGLANPLRHFEVYLGQWSISGPGRAFRILPILDGLGLAICLNTLVRAINCCTIAAISTIYVVYSISDSKLPFTHCRDFDLKVYDPILKDVSSVSSKESRFSLSIGEFDEDYNEKYIEDMHKSHTINLEQRVHMAPSYSLDMEYFVGHHRFHSFGFNAEIIAQSLQDWRERNNVSNGHIDPHLNGENVWHSGLLLLLTGLNTGGAALCALVDYIQPNTKAVYNMYENGVGDESRGINFSRDATDLHVSCSDATYWCRSVCANQSLRKRVQIL